MIDAVTDEVRGLTQGFDSFYRRVWVDAYRAVAVTISDADLASEATDEAMTRAYSRWGMVSVMDNPEGWVYRVAVNWARSRQRRRVLAIRKPVATLSETSVDAMPDPDLHQAIERLPIQQRQVVVARFLLDLSEAATAQAFGIAKGTVKSRLSRALATLRKELS